MAIRVWTIGCMLVVAGCAALPNNSSSAGADTKLRIGTYDGRAIAVAYAASPAHNLDEVLVQLFKPSERTLRTIKELRRHPLVPEEQLDLELNSAERQAGEKGQGVR